MSNLDDIRLRSFDPVPGVVPSYLEYDIQRRQRWKQQHPGAPDNDSYRALSDRRLRSDWLQYVIGRYERGGIVPHHVWHMFTSEQKALFLSCLRAQLGGVTEHSKSPNHAAQLPLNRFGDPVVLRGSTRCG